MIEKVRISTIGYDKTEGNEEQIKDLADSIKEVGLSHAIIVRRVNTSSGPEDKPYKLVSGERRLRACELLGMEDVDTEIREIDETNAKIVRCHENLKRNNLPWYEEASLVETLHQLRQTEHGISPTGRPKKGVEPTGWSTRDTAEELGMALGALSENINLARAVRFDPSLRNIKDRKTAIKLVRIAAQRNQAEVDSGAPTSFDANQVFLGDSAAVLKQFPDASVDHSITDPPWIRFFEPSLRIDERTVPVFRELYRVLKHGSFTFVFCGIDDFNYYAGRTEIDPDHPSETRHIPGIMQKIGWNVMTTPLIWVKEKSVSRRGVRSWEYDRDFEFILVAVKGSPALVESGKHSGYKSYPAVPPVKLIHPNEKPLDLIKDIVKDCSYENNIIIDPFGGSGVTAEACRALKRKYIIVERDKKTFDNIIKRLEAAK